MVVLVMGLPGSGKSYLAKRLADLTGAAYISSDRVRRDLFPAARYTALEKEKVYEEMRTLAASAAADGRSVIADATFHTAPERDNFCNALQNGDVPLFIEVKAEEDLIRQRMKHPREDSDANFETYLELKQESDPLHEEHLLLRSTDTNIDSMLDEAMRYIQQEHHDSRTDK